MTSKIALRKLLEDADQCFLVPCVYDCASARAVEMCGFPVMLLSGGELSLAMNGLIDYGFTGLTELEWMVSRISQTSSIPLIADIEDGFGGPLAVYRSAKRLSAAGAAAVQLEDAGDMENSTRLLPRDRYYSKIRAAIEAVEGTECMLIARTNADPDNPEEFEEGCTRMRESMQMGAGMAMIVKVGTYEQAKFMAERVPGWKIFADVRADNGIPSVTMAQLTGLGFKCASTHYTLKAAMEGMLEHGLENYRNQSVAHTFTHAPATGIMSYSATALFDPQGYMEMESSFTKQNKEYTIVGHKVEPFPKGFVRAGIRDRF
jgi:2-methylisocitrate lyase-like PEP mutase family enzyme